MASACMQNRSEKVSLLLIIWQQIIVSVFVTGNQNNIPQDIFFCVSQKNESHSVLNDMKASKL